MSFALTLSRLNRSLGGSVGLFTFIFIFFYQILHTLFCSTLFSLLSLEADRPPASFFAAKIVVWRSSLREFLSRVLGTKEIPHNFLSHVPIFYHPSEQQHSTHNRSIHRNGYTKLACFTKRLRMVVFWRVGELVDCPYLLEYASIFVQFLLSYCSSESKKNCLSCYVWSLS